MEQKNTDSKPKESSKLSLEKIEAMHPHQTLMILALVGIVIIFSFLMLAFWFTMDSQLSKDNFPYAFSLSTVFILLSSLAVQSAIKYTKAEQLSGANQWWKTALILGSLFGLTQIWGWIQLVNANVFLSSGVMGAYFYVISGLHLLHVLGGLLFIIRQIVRLNLVMKDPVKTLVFITNPNEMMQMKLLSLYWHFMDGIWFVIFMLFVFAVI